MDCGQPADDWSYNKSGICEVEGLTSRGRPVRYSTDLDQYDPRCRDCHHKQDRASGTAGGGVVLLVEHRDD